MKFIGVVVCLLVFTVGTHSHEKRQFNLSELITAVFNPLDAYRGYALAQESAADARRLYPGSLHNGEGDAFRHALWNYRMAQSIGASEAKKLADAHERGGGDSREKTMDLHNNAVGRSLRPIAGKTDIEVVQKAMKDGKLQTSL